MYNHFLFYSVNVDIILNNLLFYREQDQRDEWNCDKLVYIFNKHFCVGVLCWIVYMFTVWLKVHNYCMIEWIMCMCINGDFKNFKF